MIDKESMEKLTEDVVVSAIVAVGMHNQIGLYGGLPWKNILELTDITQKDLANFRKMTTDSVVVVGRNTWPSVSRLDKTNGRDFLIDGSDTYVHNEDLKFKIEVPWDFWVPKYIAKIRHDRGIGNKQIWIAGGAKTYLKWLPHIHDLHVFEIPYYGPADTYLPEEMSMPNLAEKYPNINVFVTSYY